MTKTVKVAWVNDTIGSQGRNATEEVREEIEILALELELQVELVQHAHFIEAVDDTAHKIDLLVVDYGGVMQDWLCTEQLNAMHTWAEEHPGTLVLIWTTYTYDVYTRAVLPDLQSLGNVMGRFAPGGWNVDDQLAHQNHIRAWFEGGDFAPFVPPELAHSSLVKPGRK